MTATATARPTSSRVGWSLGLLVAVSAGALILPASEAHVADSCSWSGCSTVAGVQVAADVLLAFAWLGAAAVVVLLGPRTRTTAALGTTFLAQAIGLPAEQALAGTSWALAGRALAAVALSLAVLAIAVFPDGRFVPRWAAVAWAAFVAWEAATVVQPPANGTVLDIVGGGIYFAVLAVVVGGQVYRYRRISGPVQRRQAKWLVYGFAVFAVISLLVSLPYFAGSSDLTAAGSPYDRFQDVVATLAIAVIPVCVTLAVVREGLFDVDLVIGRTLVYATLTLTLAALYVALVAGAGSALGSRGDTVLPVLAAAVVAVLFQPLRAGLQRRVRRLLYGMRDEPYEALGVLGRRLAATLPDDDVETRVVTTVREALRVPYVALAVRRDDGYAITRETGTPTANRLTLPLLNGGEEVGLLLVDEAPGGRLTEPGRALVADLARQAGPAIHGVRLTADLRTTAEALQTARERLVVAGEEERRRLRRNLHDDLAPTLAAAGLTASTAADLLGRDPEAAGRALTRLQRGLTAAVSDVRRLVDELRPVLLDEHGLADAVRERAEALRPHLDVDVDAASLPELPAAVEVAAYRICQEALMNVVRHAAARSCRVRLGVTDGFLELEVHDDGAGTGPLGRAGGVGLLSMRERAAELGGTCTVESAPGAGTLVAVRLPLRPGGEA